MKTDTIKVEPYQCGKCGRVRDIVLADSTINKCVGIDGFVVFVRMLTQWVCNPQQSFYDGRTQERGCRK